VWRGPERNYIAYIFVSSHSETESQYFQFNLKFFFGGGGGGGRGSRYFFLTGTRSHTLRLCSSISHAIYLLFKLKQGYLASLLTLALSVQNR